MYEQYHLGSSIKFPIHKIKPDKITAGTIENNFKGIIKRFVASDNAFLFMTSV